MAKSIKKITKETSSIVETILSEGPDTLAEMEAVLQKNFSNVKLTEVEAEYAAIQKEKPNASNASLIDGLKCYMDVLSVTIDQIQTLERYISLHIPKMEDGNNFGVTVQLTVAKHLSETREALSKNLESLPEYYSSRADAVDKIGLSKVTSSNSKTTTSVNSKGGKDGDESKSSETSVKEEKTVGDADVETMNARIMFVVAQDVKFYAKLRSGMIQCMTEYLTILDNVEKNKGKLSAPRGSNGGNSMGMY